MLKTGELSKVFEIDRTSLNHYVKMGLLDPEVSENQYHRYSFEDVIALSYIRYYRGLGFSMNQIKCLTQDADHQEMMSVFDERLDEIEKEIRVLNMKYRFLHHLKNSVQFHKDYRGQCVIAMTEGYYFVRKEDIQDSVLKELYKLIPSSEYDVMFDEEYNVTIESMKASQGLALKEDWIKEFNLQIPEKALYYPPEKKCLCSWKIETKSADQQIKEGLQQIVNECAEMGIELDHHFVVYVLINHYHSEKEYFDVFAQFKIKQLD